MSGNGTLYPSLSKGRATKRANMRAYATLKWVERHRDRLRALAPDLGGPGA